MIALPAMLGGFFLSEHIIEVLFSSSRFVDQDVINTANSFKILALGIPFFMLVRAWSVVPYALSQPEDLIVINTKMFFVSVVVSLLLLPSMGHLAISLGMLASAVQGAFLLHGYLVKQLGERLFEMEWLRMILMASFVMAILLGWMNVMWGYQGLSRGDVFLLLLLKSGVGLTGFFISIWRASPFIELRHA